MKTLLFSILLTMVGSLASAGDADYLKDLLDVSSKTELSCNGKLYHNYEFAYNIQTDITVYGYEDPSKLWITTGANLHDTQFHSFSDNRGNWEEFAVARPDEFRGHKAHKWAGGNQTDSISIDRRSGKFRWSSAFKSGSTNHSYIVKGHCSVKKQRLF